MKNFESTIESIIDSAIDEVLNGKPDVTALSGCPKSTLDEIARDKLLESTAQEVISLIKSKDPSYNEASEVLSMARSLLDRSKVI